jgi:hypothetical protein
VDEVVARFGGLSFPVVGKRRGAGSQQLARDMVAGACLWKALDRSNDLGGVIQQAFF